MDTRDDFYIYLSSQFNHKEFPGNSTNSFTNVIKPSLSLDSAYDVALENIIFEPDMYTIRKYDEDYGAYITVRYTKQNGSIGGYSVRYVPMSNIKAQNVFQLVQYINNDMLLFLKAQNMVSIDQEYIFRLGQFSNFIDFKELKLAQEYEDLEITWSLKEKLGKSLGIADPSFRTKPKWLDPPQLPKKINGIYIYSDIIEPTYLGEQTVHLLDIVAMPHMHYKQGTLTMYKRVNKKIIDDISIRITDESGNQIGFTETVSIMMILHFRKVL